LKSISKLFTVVLTAIIIKSQQSTMKTNIMPLLITYKHLLESNFLKF